MADLSGARPMSRAEFLAQGGGSGVGDAVGGVSNLAQAFIGDPAKQAQAGYYGAETGRAQAQTRALNQTQADGQTLTSLLTPPPGQALPSPENTSAALALASRNPEIAAKIPAMMATIYQAGVARGQGSAPGGVDAAAADRFSAGTGVAPMGSTATGQGLDLANRIQQSNIAAGPGYAAAAASRYGADRTYAASTENSKRTVGEQGRQFDTQPTEVIGPTGPTLVPRSQAAGNAPFSPTAYGANQTLTAGVGADGQPAYATPGTPGFQPPQTSDQTLARLMSTGTPAAQGGAGIPRIVPNAPGGVAPTATPPAAARPAPGAAPSSPSAPGAVPTTGNPVADAMVRAKLGIPQTVSTPASNDPKMGAEMDKALRRSAAQAYITPEMTKGFGTVDPAAFQIDPAAREALLSRVNELTHSDDPLVKNNTDAAMRRAIEELRPQMDFDHGHMPFSAGPTLRMKAAPAGGAPAPAAPAPAGASPVAAALSGSPAGEPPPAAAAAPPGAQAAAPNPASVIADAKAAIARGAPVAAVQARLQSMGINPSLLGQ